MPELRLAELVEATGGTLLRGEPSTLVKSYVIDSRRIEPDGVFFALKGARTDGHRFLGEAASNGAAAAVVESDPEAGIATPPALIRVANAEAALGGCGAFVRRKLDKVRWIAVTGSNGKTTTKEMIAAGLSAERRVHRTAGNLNNHLGVPLTLLACPDDAEVAVVELAMNAPGEIAQLTRMVDPDIGMVTNVRAVHLAFFNSLDDISAAKGELFAVMRDDATAVVNIDDSHVRIQAARHVGPQITFGRNSAADLRLEELHSRFLPGSSLSLRHGERKLRLQLKMGGAHAAFNALCALAAVIAAGGELESAADRIAALQAGPGRGKIHSLGAEILLVDESYNSSPAALASVLDTLKGCEPEGRKVLILGDMLELGNLEEVMHREAGKRAAAAGVSLLIAVGPLSRATSEVARQAGVPEVYHHKNSTKAAAAVAEYLKPGDFVVVKGSRGMRLERVVQALTSGDREEVS